MTPAAAALLTIITAAICAAITLGTIAAAWRQKGQI